MNGVDHINGDAERWLAQIEVAGQALGLFDTAQAAHEAHIAAKAELHTDDRRVMVVCTHSLGLPCPYCGAHQQRIGAPCAVIARVVPDRPVIHQLLFVGGARRTIGPDRTLVNQLAADHGVTVDWAAARTLTDGRTSWPLHALETS